MTKELFSRSYLDPATASNAPNAKHTVGSRSIFADGRSDVFQSRPSDFVGSQKPVTKPTSIGDPVNGTDEPNSIPSASGNGKYVVFSSAATNLVPNSSDGSVDVFVHNVGTDPASITTSNDNIDNFVYAVSDDGRSIAFSNTTVSGYGFADANGAPTELFVAENVPLAEVADDVFNINEDAVSTPIAILANDTIGTDVFIASVTPATNGTVELQDGEIFYSPSFDYVGPDAFSYALSTGAVGQVTLEVMPSHAQPHADANNWRLELRDTAEELAVLQAQIDGILPEISPSGVNLVVSRFAKLPGEPAMDQMAVRDGKLYVIAQKTTGNYADNDGKVFEISRDLVTGSSTVSEFFDIGAMMLDLQSVYGPTFFMKGGRGDGPRGLAFHPEFDTSDAAGYGKFYISMVATDHPSSTLLSSPPPGTMGADLHNVTFEVTYDHTTGTIASNTYREVIRDQPDVRQHPVRQISFNTEAVPGDEDYGLLYIIHGDGQPNDEAIDVGAAQQNNGSGKILRVDPLQNGSDAYSVPSTNPFVGDPNMLDEVYALGLRNEHTISFHRENTGETHLLTTGVGFSNIDEVNIVPKGANLGWALREGHFITDQMDGNTTSLSPLPTNERSLGLTYPVSYVAHDASPGNPGDVRQALSGGHVINNGSELDGLYFFADFSSVSYAYHIAAADMLAAVNQLSPGEDPSALSWATPEQAVILFNHDNDPDTTPLALGSFHELVGNATRSDIRFGRGAEDELYLMNKWDGWIYVVENSTPTGFVLPGGFEVEPTPEVPFDAVSDHYRIDKSLPALDIFAFGGAVGLIENDSAPGAEPTIVAVNGDPLTLTNAVSQPERIVEGSTGGTFRIAANGQMQFVPGGDFDNLSAGENRATGARYTLMAENGETDVAEVIVTVSGDASLVADIATLSGAGGSERALVVGSSQAYAFANPANNADWTITNAPVDLAGAKLIPMVQSSTALENSTAAQRSVSLTKDGYVYLAIQAGQAMRPNWLENSRWIATSEIIEISRADVSHNFAIYGRYAQAGESIDIGGPDALATGAEFQSLVLVSDLALFEGPDARIVFGTSEYTRLDAGQNRAIARGVLDAVGGEFVEPDSSEETDFILETFGNQAPIWLGWNDSATEGVWAGGTGDLTSFDNWIMGQPDGDDAEDYARIANGAGQWDDASATDQSFRVGSETATRASQTISELPVSEFVFSGSVYRLGNFGQDWSAAQLEAGRAGGNLLEIESEAERDFIVQTFGMDHPIWLGISDIVAEGVWLGANGAPGFTDWWAGAPNDPAGEQDYGRLATPKGRWDDGAIDATTIFVDGIETATVGAVTVIEFNGAQVGRETHEVLQGTATDDVVFASGGNDTIQGLNGKDVLLGGDGADELFGGFLQDSLFGDRGDDSINGGAGGDSLFGGNGDDLALGGIGADTLEGGHGDDELFGQGFTDVLFGGTGDDSLYGGGSSDTLNGNGGNDALHGNAAQDTLLGGAGSDFLNGGAANDELRGGGDDDTILGSTGDDRLWGGAGADVFQIRANHGSLDRIHDFEDGIDVIEFTVGSIGGFGDLILTNVLAGVDIDYGSGTVRVLGLSDAAFSNADFAFF